jgi:hypothetical protein
VQERDQAGSKYLQKSYIVRRFWILRWILVLANCDYWRWHSENNVCELYTNIKFQKILKFPAGPNPPNMTETNSWRCATDHILSNHFLKFLKISKKSMALQALKATTFHVRGFFDRPKLKQRQRNFKGYLTLCLLNVFMGVCQECRPLY